LGERAMAAALSGGWVAPEALIVWEDSADITPPDALTLLDQRKYGDTKISILQAN
jgi:16S rRNA (guanine966-N2)-methyltransferase